ncbi:hypothetical protein [Simplicispira metamorpha]|uniref:Uncharacterized protein n=1 Tax=Simplicispira metamorpha TaxID=80881 RepID=A0A4R2MX98_9BURK|nr:hypothetical protein [Simplicispira metamorpha]TCP12531.1 hypothetical protein EV674_1374 [Simplicispira metamorpha]
MTTDAIIESGMTFGPYPAGQCFYIEKSACYRQVGQGVKMAEFLLLRQQEQGPTLWVVEAKSSCPSEFTAYMDEIRVKLTNAFMLGVAACLGRHTAAKEELPEAFKNLALKTASFRFVLVIKGAPDEHLAALQNTLGAVLKPVIKTWAMSPTSVVVLNEIRAQKYGLILPTAGAVP